MTQLDTFESNWWNQELDKKRIKLNGLPWNNKKDLIKLHQNMRRLVNDLCVEDINCRRKGNKTEKFNKLFNELKNTKDIFDQHLIEALLMT